MIYKTKGIVLSSLSYQETSLIIRVYTSEFGLRSYILKGGQKRNNKLHQNLFQSLMLLDLEVYNNPKKDLQIIKAAFPINSLHSIFSDIRKSSIAFFLAETLIHSIREEERNPELFDFLEQKIISLDSLEKDFSTFHIRFMLELSVFLGIAPLNNYCEEEPYFDIVKGRFLAYKPLDNYNLNKHDSFVFSSFINELHSHNISKSPFSKQEKERVLDIMILFYQNHITNFASLKSHQILKVILN